MSRKLYPVWSPKDSIDVANEFAVWIERAEAGQLEQREERRDWLFSQSRHRKAAVMDGAAVVLLMSFMAFFGVIVYTLVTR